MALSDLSFTVPFDTKGRVIFHKLTSEMFMEICSLTSFIEDVSIKSVTERLFCIKNDLSEVPKCVECGSNIKWPYKQKHFCSTRCANYSDLTKQKRKETCLELYGCEHNFQADVCKEKRKETCLELYGFEHPLQCQDVKDKIINTNLERYGYSHHFHNEEIANKKINSTLERYGVEFYTQTYEFKEKRKQTNLKRYGAENPQQTQKIKDKISISLAKNYQSRRNEADDDHSGIVYFLYFPELNAVKIGLSGDLKTRFRGLNRDFGQFEIIKLIETEECSKLESYFHEKFSEYRICLSEGAGRTEFFTDEILSLV